MKACDFLDTNVHVMLLNHRFFNATQQLLQATSQKTPDLDVSLITTVHYNYHALMRIEMVMRCTTSPILILEQQQI